jgi:DNA polymerase (family 10)
MKHPAHNLQLAAIFHSMADCYNYLGKEERFRAIAYENAAKMLYNMPEDVAVYNSIAKLDELQGVGESIAEKILEFLATGKIKTFEQLKKQVPYDLLELMQHNGLGPATIRTLHHQLHINTKEELAQAILQHKLKLIKGFGERRMNNLAQALKLQKNTDNRLPYKTAATIATELTTQLKKLKGIQRIEIAGSLRREKETIGDLDLLITCNRANRKSLQKQITALPVIEKVIAAGATKISMQLKQPQIQVDIRIVEEDELGAALLYFTGSKEHVVQLRNIAKSKGWKLNEYGLFNKQGKWLAGQTEEELYTALGFTYIQPQERLGKDELTRAKLATQHGEQ